ncbi:MAG: [Fe-S]-binding protein [Betaproteobacteria bacterium HGW-Betaproteobacteria-7]|jgi:ferredoxin|nr:MAG: [Fe-S]-binding protein [Betaproteobacteria bacterium HGW-Betaproteobacteria-7]
MPAQPDSFSQDIIPALAAARQALLELPAPEPVPAVSMIAEGRLAIVGDLDAALGWAERLVAQREVFVLASGPVVELAEDYGFTVAFADSIALTGHLGAFELSWQHQGQRGRQIADVVLDLSSPALINRIELPDGYLAPGRNPLDQALAVIDLLAFDGEFEKPRYVSVNDRLCAHSRAQKAGCSNCIDVCATAAIQGIGDKIQLDPYLCQGCGTCTTVCPSGALSYQYPRVVDVGLAIKRQLAAWRDAGGDAPTILFHSTESGSKAIAALKREGRSLPAGFIAVECWSADAVGLELLLGAVAFGACRVAVLGAGSHDLAPLCQQARLGQTLLEGFGFTGEYLRIVDSDSNDWCAQLGAWPAPPALAAADFRLLGDKRASLEFIVDHLAKQAASVPDTIALPAGAPFGSVAVADACTLCMACVGACPAGALKAAADAPRLSFLERNCLQCGLCASTCPEKAITLTPRLLLKDRRQERLLREAEVFCCTACGKPMGAAPTILNMISKLSGHSMFATPEARARLSMCGDCRVVDLIHSEDSTTAREMTE